MFEIVLIPGRVRFLVLFMGRSEEILSNFGRFIRANLFEITGHKGVSATTVRTAHGRRLFIGRRIVVARTTVIRPRRLLRLTQFFDFVYYVTFAFVVENFFGKNGRWWVDNLKVPIRIRTRCWFNTFILTIV